MDEKEKDGPVRKRTAVPSDEFMESYSAAARVREPNFLQVYPGDPSGICLTGLYDYAFS
jgi:hypothetical protein